MGESLFDELKRYLRFGDQDERALRVLRPIVVEHGRAIADQFYARIAEHPRAGAVFEGPAQVERLKGTLEVWIATGFAGPWDTAFYDLRARIGRRHVQVGLPQEYMFAAMNLIRAHLCQVVNASALPEIPALVESVNKLIDLELAIMLHTYREDLVAKMMRTERLAAYGQLAASIAHELRNPLGVMDTSLFILSRRLQADPASLKHVQRLRDEVARSNGIIGDLLDLVRDQPADRRPTAVRALLERAVDGSRRAGGVELDLAPDFEQLVTDHGQMVRVFVNLIDNAHDACGPGGRVLIRAERTATDARFLVADDGPGVAPELRRSLFEPLVTGKARGIGLGLALCRRLVTQNGGTIALVESPLGGAAFEVRLPAGG